MVCFTTRAERREINKKRVKSLGDTTGVTGLHSHSGFACWIGWLIVGCWLARSWLLMEAACERLFPML